MFCYESQEHYIPELRIINVYKVPETHAIYITSQTVDNHKIFTAKKKKKIDLCSFSLLLSMVLLLLLPLAKP